MLDQGNARIEEWTYGSGAGVAPVATATMAYGDDAGFFFRPWGIAVESGSTNCWGGASQNTATNCVYVTESSSGHNVNYWNDINVQACAADLSIHNATDQSAPHGAITAPNCYGIIKNSTKFNNIYMAWPTAIVTDSVSSGCSAATPCLYITDTGNNRVVKVTAPSKPALGTYPTPPANPANNSAPYSAATYVGTLGSFGVAGTPEKFNIPLGPPVVLMTGHSICNHAAAACGGGGGGGRGLTQNNQVQRCPISMVTGHCTIFTDSFSDPTSHCARWDLCLCGGCQ